MPLSIETLLDLCQAVQEEKPFPSATEGKRYVVLHGIDPETMRDPPDEDEPWLEEAREWVGLRNAGEATNLKDALHLLWGSIHLLHTTVAAANGREEEEDDASDGDAWPQKLRKWLEDGPWSVPEGEVECAHNFGVGGAKALFSKSRYEVAIFGDAPYEGENACILELPVGGKPEGLDRELLLACRQNQLDRARELLQAGASAKVVDEAGDTALHYAVAHRNRPLVELLLDHGSDPNAGERYSNSPLFATLDDEGRALPATTTIENEAHFELLKLLIERGASARSFAPYGATLADLAAAVLPWNERYARYFVEKGASTVHLLNGEAHGRPLDHLLSSLHFDTPETRKKIPNWIRLLGLLGIDPNAKEGHWGNRTTLEDFLSTGYSADEVEPEAMVEIAKALVEIGAHDEVGEWDKRPSERADNWAKYEDKRHYAEVAEVLRRGASKKAT